MTGARRSPWRRPGGPGPSSSRAAVARGELDGRIAAGRQDARWAISGDATARNLVSAGADAKKGADPARLGPIRAAWDVEGQHGTWTARRLELAMPYARIAGEGTLDVADGIARVDLKGSLAPDWDAIQADLRRDVEPNARIAGRSREWRVAGSVGGNGSEDRLSGLVGELGVQLDALDIFGMRLGQTAVVLRADGGRLRFDPIDARLNEGALHLEPEVVRPKDGPFRLKLGAASTLEDAVVNDEVSHRVLSYVAPVLDGATRVRGRVSVRRARRRDPARAPRPGRPLGSRATCSSTRSDSCRVRSPRRSSTCSRTGGRGDTEPMLVLRDPISVRIAERKVYQRGLIDPPGPDRLGGAGRLGRFREDTLTSWPDSASTRPGPTSPLLAALLNDARFELPIRGTLEDPRIDEEAMKERLKSMGTDMLENSIVAGADGLMRLLEGCLAAARRGSRPRTPPAPSRRPSRSRPGGRRPRSARRSASSVASNGRRRRPSGGMRAGRTAGMSLEGNRREDATAGTPSPIMQIESDRTIRDSKAPGRSSPRKA